MNFDVVSFLSGIIMGMVVAGGIGVIGYVVNYFMFPKIERPETVTMVEGWEETSLGRGRFELNIESFIDENSSEMCRIRNGHRRLR